MEALGELLDTLVSKGVKLSAESGQLNCYAPKGTLTSELRDAISRNKSALLAWLEKSPVEPSRSIPATEFPLSVGQKGLYLLQQLNPSMGAYNVPLCFRLDGPVEADLIAKAWDHVLEQYPILTARVVERDGIPYQQPHSDGRSRLEQLRVECADERELWSLVRERARRPFDLNRGPLTRIELLTLDSRRSVLLLTVHHIVFDGSSAVILLAALLRFWQQLREGKPIRLSRELPGYREFVRWEEELLASPEGAAHGAYWEQQLSGELPVLQLTPDQARPVSPSFEGETLVAELPDELSAWVREFARAHAVPLSVMFLAPFQLVLLRYSGQDEVIVGMPVMGRAARRFGADVGYFINVVPLRLRGGEGRPLGEHLRSVHRTMLDALYHSSYPFPRMLDRLGARQMRKDPVFQVTYAYQNFIKEAMPSSVLQQPELRIESVPWIAQEGDSDLGLDVFENAASFRVHLKFNPDVHERALVERLFAHYQELLHAIRRDPERVVDEYSLITAAEQRRLLVEFNATGAEYPTGLCLHELFLEQVSEGADRVAVVCGAERVTYGQLEQRSGDLALYLQAQGVGPDALVGVCMERSVEMVVGLLGILRAGGAYVPLDAAYPEERLGYMLRDSGAGMVLTQTKLSAGLSGALPGQTRLIELDGERAAIVEEVRRLRAAGTVLKANVGPRDLAYVIYTSGSTGQPKGVAIEHHSPVTLVQWAREVYSASELSGVLAATSICFDLSVYEIFVTLGSGGTVFVVPNALGLLDLAHKDEVTLINTVPSAMEELVRLGAIPGSVCTVNLAGEPLSSRLVDRVYASGAVKKVYDLYGPSEDTTYSTYVLRKEGGRQTIGRPIANTRVYILDRHQRLQPVGIPGELHIAGDGLARGYLHREELTREKFVANPFEPGGRMYRTGDLARWLEDGTLQYLGRIDTQVKIRGFRIELGEIEARLNQHAGIQDGVVIARGEEGNKQLVAFYRAQATTPERVVELASEELRAHLSQTLPEYMLPAGFVSLASIPLTPNGKVDRRALSRLEVGLSSGREYVAPRDETERRLAEIWAEVLNRPVESIGVHDSFFELGGHSLLATQVMAKIRAGLEVELALKTLFERTSVAQLGEAVATAKRSEVPPLRPIDRARFERLPLSFAQERLWFIHELEPDSPGYNVPGALRMRGELDVERLERALSVIVARHESLRTVFPSHEGRPYQRILEPVEFRLERVDLRGYGDEAAREAQARRLCRADAGTPFDLARGPLLRGQVIRLGEREHILMLNMHHIISDGWSNGVLVRELGLILQALSEGRVAPLEPLPIQYVDYSVWQRRWLEEGGVLARQLSYWREKLSGVAESLDLPTDHPRPSVQSVAGATLEFGVEASLTARLKELAAREGATLYMVLLAVFKVLLHRYTGQEDVCVGSPIANRQYGETAGLIGMFVNTLALRTRLEGEDTFTGLLSKVRTTCLEAYENQDAPFEKVVDALQLERNLAVSPLFQVMLILQNAERGVAGSAAIERYPIDSGISKFDLTLEFTETAQGLSGVLEYSTALYERATIERWAEHFNALCRAVTARPTARIGELEYLSAAEQRRLLVEFNATGAEYPTGLCLHELFLKQVSEGADRVAVVCGAERVTYGQLEQRSGDLALYLQAQGVGPDALVGVCMERSVEMVVGLLGILRAGGAYVPLDAAYPEERLGYMLRDSGAGMVLTQTKLSAGLSGALPGQTRLIELDGERAAIAEEVRRLRAAGTVLKANVGPRDLAYVIYTSGSTGQPKGVAIEHHSPVTLVQWAREVYSASDLSGVLAATSICFDLSVYEIFVTLGSGGTVFVVPNALGLLDLAHKDEVTLINTVPSAMEELVRLGAIPGSVCTVNLAGEPLSSRLVDRVYASGAVKKVYDLYGPSEDTTYSTYVLRKQGGRQTIGRPIANTRVYILDRHQRLQPVGIPGELHIAGDGLARGYLHREELTREKFVANPFEPGGRMYRTGDLARWLEDGTLQYLGRIDTQVKIRGFRIELGEIEARLNQHAGIQDGVVIARGEEGNKQLVAFYRAQATTPERVVELASEELRAHLSQTLPEYMLPAGFVSLASIPLTPNGKVDRRALSRLEVGLSSGREYVAPRDETERRLAEIWAEVLNRPVESIGIHDSFFELGGHSLLATQVMARIRARLGVELALKTLFERTSVAQLGEAIATAKRSEVPPLRPIDRTSFERLPLSFAQERLWFLHELEPDSPGYNVPGALRVRGELDVERLEHALSVIVARHESLRTVFASHEGRPYQRILESVELRLQRVDLRGYGDEAAREAEARRLCRADAGTPFDLSRGPLLRGQVIRLGERAHILMLNMHHIISDGWSNGVLVRELELILDALGDGRVAEREPLPIQYVDYSVWQRRWLEEGGVLARQLSYWREKLSGVAESLDLPTDHPRPSVQSVAGATLEFGVEASLTARLKELAAREGATLYMVLLAVFKVLLHRYTGQEDVCVGSPIANRQYGETAGLIGMFVNTLALRTRLEGEDTFTGLLSKVRTTCLEAYENQDAPFEKVVDALQLERNLAVSPLFQVMLILQNAERGVAGSAAIERYPIDSGISKFDLTLEFTETAEGLSGVLEYSTALYERATVERWSEHFNALCRAVTARPAARIGELEYLSAAEQRRLLVEFNATGAEYPTGLCLHELFLEQVSEGADRVAVVCGAERVTYGQLEQRSGDLALYLQAQGVGPDALVGVCMERSVEMVVGLLGILRAGGAYVPLDAAYPEERLGYMLRDSGAGMVLTQTKLSAGLSGALPGQTRLIELDGERAAIAEEVRRLRAAGTVLKANVGPRDLAYVIYTSGSTGQPKGVAIEHHSPVTLVQWAREVYSAPELSGVLAATSICFDLSVYEIFVTLGSGGTVFVVPNALGLLDLAHKDEVTLINTVPSAMEELVRLGAIPGSVCTVNLAGEPLSSRLVDRVYASGAVKKVYDLYGPSEDTTYSTYVLRKQGGRQTIGRPIANTRVYILDRHQRLQPVGIPGELHIAGDGLARGYLHREELTREKFVSNPFEPGERMYRTGDLARWLEDGTLQYLGRIDTQVKIRGFRIELGEIEARLNQHAGIQDGVVIARGEEGNKQLVAFYRAQATTPERVVELPSEELRAHLSQTLPEYMLPAGFVSLASIPLTPNGKVDRRALSRLEVGLSSGREYVAPRDETERRLAEIWAEVLNRPVESIGIHDSFFELGGHSLLATQVMARIRARLGVELALKTLFERTSVAQLGEAIATAKRSEVPPLRPIDRTRFERLPLSFAQERLWFLHELEPDSPGYNVPGALRVRGELDVERLEHALSVIVARHESLRTVFASHEGRPYQRILESVEFRLQRVDLRGYGDGAAREAEARRLCRADAGTPFDLSRGPLLRGQVIRLGEREHILMLNMHHIISDGWSNGVLVRELELILDALGDGRVAEREPLPIQYVDYSVWQRRWLEEGGVLARQLSYWREKLAGVPESLDLPTDHPRPSVQSVVGATLEFGVEASLTARLKELAEREGATLYMVLLAVFKVLLHRYTGQEDVCVGSPIANRQYGETAGLIGMFVNTLALRTRLEGQDTFTGLLSKVRTTCLEAYENQDAPFEKVLDALQLERNLTVSPLFQVMLILQNAEQVPLDSRLELYPIDSGISKFDLTLEFTETADGLSGSVRYRSSLYERATIERLVGHIVALCQAVTSRPGTHICELDYLSDAEKRELLVDRNRTAAAYPHDRCLHELFAEQVQIEPDRLAVVFGEQQLTYRQLDEKSAELASYLRAQGVKPGALVGLHTERSLDMVVGLLGILRAGGAYVPLDPDYPPARLQHMVEDVAPALVLTQARLRERLSATAAALVVLDGEWSRPARIPTTGPAADGVEAGPEDLAYVIYTSGSSGQPKGVMVRHRNVVHLWSALERAIYAGHADWTRVSVNASLSFDSSVKQLVQLLSGRTLVLVPRDVRMDAAALVEFISDQEVDVFDCTPSQLTVLLSAGLFDGTRRVPKAFLVGGEAIDPGLWRSLSGRSETTFYNVYGPAECTVDATVARVTADEPRPHIGRPLANVEVYILDRGGQPVPMGVVGEICIGGAGVAAGYWCRPELTAERFVADPFSARPHARLYRSGDLGRWRADGNVEHVGRNDQQVKLRGQRIELGEIETRLALHPEVKDAVVIARGEEGNKQLVAFYRAQATTPERVVELASEELRAHLSQTLPEYMLPAGFVSLASIPLTPNGKVDRRALSRLEVGLSSGREYVAPRDETERRLAEIWAEVLNRPVESIGVHDSFFELGGHSLLATQVMAKTRAGLGVELALKTLFERTSVAQLGEAVATAKRSGIAPLRPIDRTSFERLPLSFAQERLWFIHELEPDSPGYNVPGALRMRGELDVERLERALSVIVARHESLRTVFPSHEGRPYQRILEPVEFRLERVDLRGYGDEATREAEARRLCRADAGTPFDLSRGPLLRGQVIRLGEREHILMLNMHHIISDGWSNGVLVRELGLILQALSEGRVAPLEPLPIQYVDYSVWQRRRLEEGGVLARQLSYWREKLSGVAENLDLPTDHPRPSVQSVAGATLEFGVAASLTARLKQLAAREGATLYMVLLAVFKVLLHRYTGQEDVCVGSPIANRQYGETEGLIGMFVNTLALRTRLEGQDTFTGLLSKVRTTCLEAYENQDAPFEKVVDALQLERNLAVSPLFQVMLILQNAERGVAGSAAIERYPIDSGISKFDLTLEFTETAEGLSGVLEYSTALYERATVERWAEHFTSLCRAVTARPAARIGELEYLSAAEQRRLLVEFNATGAEYPTGLCLHELFLKQVSEGADRVAVVCGAERVTYGQLEQRSGDLALYLQAQGVGPDALVGVCMERSVEMVVGLLGILRAGGAYVPLDAAYPEERLGYMLRDSGAGMVLTQTKLSAGLSGALPGQARLIELDGERAAIAEEVRRLRAAGTVSKANVGPRDLAYVIYTSGSTGQPKGVAIEHHSPVTLVQWAREVYSASELSGVLAATSICFDLSVYEIFVTLGSGGTVFVVPNALGLLDLAHKDEVTLINTVPSAMEELVRLGAIPGSVCTVNLAGEPLSSRLVDRVYASGAVKKVYDLYGPSEDTTYSTYVLRKEGGRQTIGRPIANTRVYILDRHQRLQPVGIPGELHIAGDGLARGYLHREQLTREKFVANPFEPGGRMYRTGDLARWLEDGTLQYLGRIDTQVKIRGFRIELGEIEARLNQHAGIQDGVVIARGEEGNKQLVAFYRAQATTPERVVELASEELRAHLSQTLPEYMLPAGFVSLASIPLTPNGKVDRRALGRLEVGLSSGREYVAPRDETERRLAEIWAEVLNRPVESIGVHDSFFELGGHSLLATQVMAKIHRHTTRLLPLATLFTAPSIAALAQVIAAEEAPAFGILVPIRTGGDAPPVFALPGIGGNVLSLQPLSRALGDRRPLFALQAVGLDGRTPPFGSVEQTARANIAAMKRAQPEGPYSLIGHSYGGVVAYEMARTLLERGDGISALILLDSLAPAVMQSKAVSDEATELADAVAAIAALQGARVEVDAERLRRSSREENARYVVGLLKGRGLEIDPSQFAAFQSVYRANLEAYRRYQPVPLTQTIAVSLYRATVGHPEGAVPHDYGWNALLRNPVEAHDVEADHFSILEKVRFAA